MTRESIVAVFVFLSIATVWSLGHVIGAEVSSYLQRKELERAERDIKRGRLL